MQGMEKRVSFAEQLGRYSRYMRSLPQPFNPVVPMLGGADLVQREDLGYAARWAGDDADGCIREVAQAGLIELHRRNPCGYRRFDVYRVTAKGRGVYERFRECRERVEALHKEDRPIRLDAFVEMVERGELLQVPEDWADADEKGLARRAAPGRGPVLA